MAIETMALAELADAGAFISLMTKEIFGLTAQRVFCKTDIKSLEKHLISSKGNTRPLGSDWIFEGFERW